MAVHIQEDDAMSTTLPFPDAYPEEVVAWWNTLSDQERIIHALRAYDLAFEDLGGGTLFFCVAMYPWKYAREAYELRNVAWREPPEEES